MKITQLLLQQHIYKGTLRTWHAQRERSIPITNAERVLNSLNLKVKDPAEVLSPVIPRIYTEFKFDTEQKVEEIPNHETPCLTYSNHLLAEGIIQAQVLTKTVYIENDFPEKIEQLTENVPESIDDAVKRVIWNCTIFDAYQEKLPKLKNPEKLSWVYPRVYGITVDRKMRNLSKKFLHLCDMLSGPADAQNRSVVIDGHTTACVEKESEPIKFIMNEHLMVTASKPIGPLADQNMYQDLPFPDIYPLHPTVSLVKTNSQVLEDIYPVRMESPWENVHTIFVHHDPEKVTNITELPVKDSQILSHALLKSFTVAASFAKNKYGKTVKQLPNPVTVQCIYTNGQNYHFSVLQLNTLDIDGTEGVRNFWWSGPSLDLYEKAEYYNGQPVLEGYNPEVFKRVLAFYKNR